MIYRKILNLTCLNYDISLILFGNGGDFMARTQEMLEMDIEVNKSVKIMDYHSTTDILKAANNAVLRGIEASLIVKVINSMTEAKKISNMSDSFYE